MMKRYTLIDRIFCSFVSMCVAMAFASCDVSLPAAADTIDALPHIYPDYTDLTIPSNIAPLNFKIDEEGTEYITSLRTNRGGFAVKGQVADMDIKKWKDLISQNVGDTIYVDVYVKSNGRWRSYQPLKWTVAEEIDPYISYRLIEPSYISFEEMCIAQRRLEDFEETTIFSNSALSKEDAGQCMNCHSYQDYNRQGNMQMHIRVNHGGTVIVYDGKVKKVNLKTPSTISAGVYPSWHPQLPLIAYSVNTTSQNFHSINHNKVEVQDAESDLILYDVEKNLVTVISNDTTQMETFPSWSPDGNALYYVSANVPKMSEDEMMRFQAMNYEDFKYDIFRRSFDRENLKFGNVDTVFMASERGMSATLPRVSPDGRYLLFAMAPYGTFHIWHKDADLYVMDLQSGELRSLDELNSNDVESYHSWSSNGRWILFSSRRDDGSYTRLYLAHFDKDGRCSKPFILPQKDPDHNLRRFKSYNVPEFMAEPVGVKRSQFIDAISADAQAVNVKTH